MELLSFVLVFGLLVFVHELGHLIAAKAFGVRVDEFGFGYPPRLVSLGSIGGTEITLNLIPLGGFVRMNEDDPTIPDGIASRSRKVRAVVFAAGSIMNLLLAVALYGVTYMRGALEPVEKPGAGIYSIAVGSPADEAGLQPGDNILAVDGQEVASVEDAIARTGAGRGQAHRPDHRARRRCCRPSAWCRGSSAQRGGPGHHRGPATGASVLSGREVVPWAFARPTIRSRPCSGASSRRSPSSFPWRSPVPSASIR